MLKNMEEFKDYPDAVLRQISKELEGLAELAEKKGDKSGFGKSFIEHIKNRKVSLQQQEARARQALIAQGRTREKMANFNGTPLQQLQKVIAGAREFALGDTNSIANRQAANKGQYSKLYDGAIANLPKEIKASFEAGELDRDLYNEMAYQKNPVQASASGISQNANQHIQNLAKTMLAVENVVKQDYERALGHPTGNLDERLVKGRHDAFKIAGVSRETWKSDILSGLDFEKTYGPNAGDAKFVNEHLNDAYDRVTKSNFQDATKGRTFFFKSPDAEFSYGQKYGYNSLDQAIRASINEASNSIPLMETFGPDFEAGYDKMRKQAFRDTKPEYKDGKAAYGSAAAKAKVSRWWTDVLWNNVNGVTASPATGNLAMVANIVRGIFNLDYLGNTGIRTASNTAVAAGYMQATFGEGFAHMLSEQVEYGVKSKGFGNAEASRAMGIAVLDAHAGVAGEMNMQNTVGSVNQTMAKINRGFFRLNGLTYSNEFMTALSSSQVGRQFGKVADKAFGDLPAGASQALKRAGIDETRWEIMKLSAQELPFGQVLTPNRYLNPQIVADMFGISPKKASELVVDTAIRYGSLVQEATKFATTTPETRLNAFLNLGLEADHPGRIAWGMINQFKSFNMQQLGNMAYFYSAAQKAGASQMGGLMAPAVVASGMAASWYMGQRLIDAANGKSTRYDITTPSGWADVVIKSGAGGVLGDYADALFGFHHENATLKYLAGPAGNFVSDVADVASAAKAGKNVDSAAGALIYNAIPGQNLPGLNRLYMPQVLNMMSYITPKYVQKRRMQDLKRELENSPQYSSQLKGSN